MRWPSALNAEYEEFRSTTDVTDSDDMKVRAFIRWIPNKLVVDRNDLGKITTRRRDIRNDGLIRIPPTFRAILKNLPAGSEYSVKFDEVLSSVVRVLSPFLSMILATAVYFSRKESRRKRENEIVEASR
ncbi:hypothetical protein Y032_0100g3228 [Ancylostoma ceylanicum]|uniref:Uncharacterized protein n=1 Tax=Ancylostoma ceylanicum TaxID=53326 RepID=A0A016TI27_9BILA|nr:hypothetical protein Y032_0100g3228 [Ancylostoma ceylanicum]